MSSVILPKQIDVSKLKYSDVKTLKSGAKSVYINYGDGKLTVQTPALYLPYGISPPYSEKKEDQPSDKYIPGSALDVSFRGMEENPKVKLFYDKLKEIEDKLVEDAFNNRQAWFKDDFDDNKAFVKKLFSPMIKIDKDTKTGKPLGKYPPTFKAKVQTDLATEQPNIDCYDMDNNELDFLNIFNKLKGAKVVLIVQLTGLWMAGGKYGCSWKVCSGKFQISPNVKVAFVEDSEDDKESSFNDDEEEIVPEVPVEVKQSTKRVIPDEDEEEEEEEEDEEEVEEEEEEVASPPRTPSPPPEPVVAPPAPKKKVTKKKV